MAAQDPSPSDALARTPLHGLHRQLKAKLVPFAGYEMPVQYPMGVLGEHRHTRVSAGLFDVSHMGQVILRGPDHETTAAALERVVPGEIAGLKPGRMRYTVLLNQDGGILDDLMVTRLPQDGVLFIVWNASRKDTDLAYLQERLPASVTATPLDDAALVALQGPKASAVMARFYPDVDDLRFMMARETRIGDVPVLMTRSGYTGEDGFEISLPGEHAERFVSGFLDEPEVMPIGLGARDSLRLEAGLCLYGNDLDEKTTPVEADLAFVIGKRRREAADFPGATRILEQLAQGPSRRRVGIVPEGKAPARAGAAIESPVGEPIGTVTSGTFAPTVEGPIAMGYVDNAFATPDSAVSLIVRGQARVATVSPMPFVPHRYYRG